MYDGTEKYLFGYLKSKKKGLDFKKILNLI